MSKLYVPTYVGESSVSKSSVSMSAYISTDKADPIQMGPIPSDAEYMDISIDYSIYAAAFERTTYGPIYNIIVPTPGNTSVVYNSLSMLLHVNTVDSNTITATKQSSALGFKNENSNMVIYSFSYGTQYNMIYGPIIYISAPNTTVIFRIKYHN